MSKNDGPAATSFLASSKTGWLTKHGGSGIKGNWKKRWFVLDHHYLFYYESTKDKHPKGIICLPDYKECRRAEKAECQKKHSFILIPDPDLVEPGSVARTYYIYGDSEDECNNWVDAILEEMRPTIGIQKQKDKAKSLPEHSKMKISSSVKVTKKDLDVVTTAAASGGPQLTHLTKERAQVPKRRPPRKFKPMDEDDDPAIGMSEVSQLQPSPSKKPAVDNVNKTDNHVASPVKNLSDSSPRISGKKPVLPPSSSKPKVDVTGGVSKEQSSPSLKAKGNPPVPPPKSYKEVEHNGLDEVKDTTSAPLKESKDETMDITDSSLPTSPPVTKPKPLRVEDNKSVDITSKPSPDSATGTSCSNAKANPVKEEVVDNANDDSPTVTPTNDVALTKPEPLEEPPAKESPDAVDTRTSSTASDHPVTKPSNTVESMESSDTSVNSVTASATDSEPPTKAKSSDTVENNIPTPSAAASVAANRPFAKPRPPAKHPRPKSTPSKDRIVGIVEEAKDKLSTENQVAEKSDKPVDGFSAQVKAEEVKSHVENSLEAPDIQEPVEIFSKPKPPAKHPRPKNSPSKDRNLVVVEKANGKLSTENQVAEKTDKPADGFSAQAEEIKSHVETSLEAPDIQEPAEKLNSQDKVVNKGGKEKEIMMGETVTAPDKVSMEKLPRPKPKPRMSNVPKSPSATSVLLPADKKIATDENHNEDIKDKLDSDTKPKEAENGIVPTAIETGVNTSNENSDVSKGQVIEADEATPITPSEHKANIEVDDVDALYSVVELNRSSEERESKESTRNSRETTPKHHDYDLVAISPRSKSPEEEDPGYDIIGGVVKKESISAKESIYDNWKLKKAPEASSSKTEVTTNNGEGGYAVIDRETENEPVSDLTVSATTTVPQYAQVHKHTKTQQSEALYDDITFDALRERLGSSIPAHLDEAKEMLRLAMVARQEAEQLKKEAAEDREVARRERMEAEQLKKNATEILEMAKQKTAS